MSYLDAVILGVVQGLTEFLPVSSSGHLVLAQGLLGVRQPGISFEVTVHLGTVLAVLVYFHSQLARVVRGLFVSGMKSERRLMACLVIGTVPAALIGVLLAGFVERTFDKPAAAALLLLITAAVLFLTRYARRGARHVSVGSAVAIGIAQALAILPGVSRSGVTIAAGMYLGVTPSHAAEFSFLLSIPAILGAVVLKANEFARIDASLAGPYLVGLVVAFATALAAVSTVLAVVRKGKLHFFAYYCVVAGAIGLYLFL